MDMSIYNFPKIVAVKPPTPSTVWFVGKVSVKGNLSVKVVNARLTDDPVSIMNTQMCPRMFSLNTGLHKFAYGNFIWVFMMVSSATTSACSGILWGDGGWSWSPFTPCSGLPSLGELPDGVGVDSWVGGETPVTVVVFIPR